MTFEEKLKLREKLMADFIKAGKANAFDILKVSFGDASNQLPVLDKNYDHQLKIQSYHFGFHMAHDGGVSLIQESSELKERFISNLQLKKNSLTSSFANVLLDTGLYLAYSATFLYRMRNIAGAVLDFVPSTVFIKQGLSGKLKANTLAHENIHYLQEKTGIKNDLKEMDVRYIQDECDQKAKDRILETHSECELMPRLDGIISTYCLMGNTIPKTFKELMLVFYNGGLDPAISSEEDGNKICAYFGEDLNDIMYSLLHLKPEAVQAGLEKIGSSYMKLLAMYGIETEPEDFYVDYRAMLGQAHNSGPNPTAAPSIN